MSMDAANRADAPDIQEWSAEELQTWQAGRLRDILRYAAAGSDFYRSRWDAAGIDIGQIRSLEDLRRVPIVDKQDMLDAGEAWLASGSGRVGFSTRGTSGNPLVLWLDDHETDAYTIPAMRGFVWAGFQEAMTALLTSPAWHKLAAMEGHAVRRLGGHPSYFWGSLGGVDHIDAFLEALEEVRPHFVTSTLPFLLNALHRCRQLGRDPQPLFASVTAIVVVGLPLTPHLRRYLEESLGVARVAERSGTQEGAALDECAVGGTPHAHSDVCVLEILDASGRPVPAGQHGRLVVTKLVAGGSPFVRYDTGDLAVVAPEPCACGSALPRVRLAGRPESSVRVGGERVTAWDVRCCVDEDPALVGRVLLLVHDGQRADALRIAIEGEPTNEGSLRARLAERLLIDDVEVAWLGGAKISWGFRQVIDAGELRRR